MIIIVEGPNGVGKTTFAKKLAEKFNLQYIKENKPKGGFEYYLNKSIEYNNCVLDRFHFGEYVYPKVKKDERVPIKLSQMHEIEKILISKKCIMIYCNTSFDFKKNTFETRGEDYVTVNDINYESELFDIIFENSILEKFKIDLIKNDDLTFLYKRIENLILNKM